MGGADEVSESSDQSESGKSDQIKMPYRQIKKPDSAVQILSREPPLLDFRQQTISHGMSSVSHRGLDQIMSERPSSVS